MSTDLLPVLMDFKLLGKAILVVSEPCRFLLASLFSKCAVKFKLIEEVFDLRPGTQRLDAKKGALFEASTAFLSRLFQGCMTSPERSISCAALLRLQGLPWMRQAAVVVKAESDVEYVFA